MENNNYRSITPLKRKKRKITAPAALILCIIFLVVGIMCGKAFSSANKKLENAQAQIALLKEETEKIDKLKETYKKAINDLKAENADLKKQISEAEAIEAVVEEVPSEEAEAPVTAVADDEEETPKKASGGALRVVIIVVLAAIIIVCVLAGISLFLKKNEDDDEDDDEDDEEFDDDEEFYDDEEDEE